jgi:DNA-binding CsgD family transcriptional regulator
MATTAFPAELIDHIYECAFVPDLWPDTLHRVAQVAEARGGLLFAINTNVGVLRSIASEGLREELVTYISGGWLSRDRRRERVIELSHAGFVRELDAFTQEEIDADPVYRGFLFPVGLGWAAATSILLPTGDALFLTVERDRIRGPVEPASISQLDTLRPHLARSALMSARLLMERARIASETLALLGLPALVFDERGKVLAANDLIEALGEHLQWRPGDRVTIKDARADELFQRAVVSIDKRVESPVQSFAIRSNNAVTTIVAHIVPIRGHARDIFVRCAGVLVLTPVNLPLSPSIELVQSLFDLSPAEARVARALTAGQSVAEIASAGGVSQNTVRTQVRRVLEKTGCHRQSDVIALLKGIAVRQN